MTGRSDHLALSHVLTRLLPDVHPFESIYLRGGCSIACPERGHLTAICHQLGIFSAYRLFTIGGDPQWLCPLRDRASPTLSQPSSKLGLKFLAGALTLLAICNLPQLSRIGLTTTWPQRFQISTWRLPPRVNRCLSQSSRTRDNRQVRICLQDSREGARTIEFIFGSWPGEDAT